VEYSPFYGIEKSAVLQEARMFNDRVVDARRCQQVTSATSPTVAILSAAVTIWPHMRERGLCCAIGSECGGSVVSADAERAQQHALGTKIVCRRP